MFSLMLVLLVAVQLNLTESLRQSYAGYRYRTITPLRTTMTSSADLKELCLPRLRTYIAGIGLFLAGTHLQPCWAIETPKTTARVSLDFSVARGEPKTVRVDLYGTEAPLASKVFMSLCAGDRPDGVSFDDSSVSRLIKNEEFTVGKFRKGSDMKQITEMDSVGKVRIKSVDLAERVVHSDSNSLAHEFGSISVPRGGKSFAFTVGLGSSPRLDDENVVIGKVVEDVDSALAAINQVRTSREDSLGMKGNFAALGRAAGDGRAKLASVDRPLTKIQLLGCTVDSVSSITSTMR